MRTMLADSSRRQNGLTRLYTPLRFTGPAKIPNGRVPEAWGGDSRKGGDFPKASSEHPPGPAPWVDDGPLWPRDTLLLGTWWVLREIELAVSQARHLTFSQGADCRTEVSWRLPASN